ncbi:UNVERIFIED_CONTAM: Zinc finger protein ENHYDROUS [Sesamum calycinum]|uniref:Zinc finger protein ENHYDROUS n=1 Tax=Sesamum calycinum TaxID=2727403 RepID=A0AAW2SEW5_9LAMI
MLVRKGWAVAWRREGEGDGRWLVWGSGAVQVGFPVGGWWLVAGLGWGVAQVGLSVAGLGVGVAQVGLSVGVGAGWFGVGGTGIASQLFCSSEVMFPAVMSNSNPVSEEASISSAGPRVQDFGSLNQLLQKSTSSNHHHHHHHQPQKTKKKRNLPGNPDPDAEVIALSPKTLLATNRFICEICNKDFREIKTFNFTEEGTTFHGN